MASHTGNAKVITADGEPSTENRKEGVAANPTVHNPFDGSGEEIPKEEVENMEQFKEAQTERD